MRGRRPCPMIITAENYDSAALFARTLALAITGR